MKMTKLLLGIWALTAVYPIVGVAHAGEPDAMGLPKPSKYIGVAFTNLCLRTLQVTKITYKVDGVEGSLSIAPPGDVYAFRQTRTYDIPHDTFSDVMVTAGVEKSCFQYRHVEAPKPVALACGWRRFGYQVYLSQDRQSAEVQFRGRSIEFGKLALVEGEPVEQPLGLLYATKDVADAGYEAQFTPGLNPGQVTLRKVSLLGNEPPLATLRCYR